MKFTKIVDTEIRRAKFDDGKVFAIIGQVKELLEKEIIYPDNTSGNEEKWLGVEQNDSFTRIREFDTLEDAKNYYKSIHEVRKDAE